MAAKKRLESCGGKEAGWVTAIPSRPEYRMTSQQWRDRFAVRLGLPLPFLRAGPTSCDCHDAFTRRSGAIAQGAPGAQRPLPPGSRGRITRVPRPPVDPFGEHEQRCPFAFKLGPHNRVQLQHQRNLNRADLRTKLASVHELRTANDPRSQKQADLLTSGLAANGNETLLDVGRTHPLIDTNLTNQSLGNRAYAADKYAESKDRRYRRIINDNNLPYGYKSLCMDTFGAFGESLWSVIDRATDPNTHPKASGDYDPWRRPDPRREYVLSVAFANQAGDAIMVRGADARRRRNRSGGRYATGARA